MEKEEGSSARRYSCPRVVKGLEIVQAIAACITIASIWKTQFQEPMVILPIVGIWLVAQLGKRPYECEEGSQ